MDTEIHSRSKIIDDLKILEKQNKLLQEEVKILKYNASIIGKIAELLIYFR